MRSLIKAFNRKGYKSLLAIVTPKHIKFSKHPMRILPQLLKQQGRDLYNLQALFVAWMRCMVYLTNFDKPLNDPCVIDMFYQCTDNPDLLFQLTRNDRESKDPTIQARFNSNTIVTTLLQYLQDNKMMSSIWGTPRTSRQPYTFKNRSAPATPLIPRLPNPAIKQVNYVNNNPMSDYNNYVFGMNCEKVSQIQDCLVYSVAKLTDFFPNALDEDKTQMTDRYIQALAKYA